MRYGTFFAGGTLTRSALTALLAAPLCAAAAFAQQVPTNDPPQYGPYNGHFLTGGLGLRTPLTNVHDTVLQPDSPWTLLCWYRTDAAVPGLELLAGVGDVSGEYPRYLAVENGRVALWMGKDAVLSGPATVQPGTWHLLTATFDGAQFRLYSDGVATASGDLLRGTPSPVLQMAPPLLVPEQAAHFGGKIAGFRLLRQALTPAEIKSLKNAPPSFDLLAYEEGSKPWPFQTHGQAGYEAPPNPGQLPVSRAPFGKPFAIKRPPVGPSLTASAAGEWTFTDGWTLREEPKVSGTGEQIATGSFAATDWMRATVPGTVLTTMVDDGIYPEPDYGLNNMAIPESLNKQDYWYRNVFTVPAEMRSALQPGAHVELGFLGINYKAEVWLNGHRLGSMVGAFRRGSFDVSAYLKPGEQNALAVRIAPPPHPGIPHEQSILAGGGENGGSMELDGPTFLPTEGWDWIPAIRDRDTGIWQPVTLKVTHQLQLGDTQVVTTFQNHNTARASVALAVPVTNGGEKPVEATIDAVVDGISVHKSVTVPAGTTTIRMDAQEFPQLVLEHPRLWWPNGYGKPELYTVKLTVASGGNVSDTKQVRFGVREVSYELSLLDSKGNLRRVEYTPAAAPGATKPIVDVSHEGMRRIPGADAIALKVPEPQRDRYEYNSVVSSLPASSENSPAITASSETGAAPYLVLKVNGVRIAARGGNWGMDDARKRVSREHLEPFFRLNQTANLNIIRNWVGQSDEEVFYDLADEYGMLVWNDFWESTQNYNIETQDPALFLDNAADVIQHFRNHPSIVVWCGRNEGVPQPIINEGLEALTRTLDGTRFYSPSSNQVNLQQSGPYSYQDPALYYTTLNRGFSMETGTPSMSTLESFMSTTPKQDQWPIDDVWAYHDWHQAGNGRMQPFMQEMETEFGAPTSLPDFERKAQMLNYVNHRAIFEGMNANLWSPNSARLLWMTQPAWPSTTWQILSSDYDTQASFYGSQKACEPVHVQLNLATHQVDVVNTTVEFRANLSLSVRAYGLDNTPLLQQDQKISVGADAVLHSLKLDLNPLLQRGMVIVELKLADAAGHEVSRNLYWLGASSSAYRALTRLEAVPVHLTATSSASGDETTVTVTMTNTGKAASLANKLTLLHANGERVLPAYLTDNYVSLLPGESATVKIRFATVKGKAEAKRVSLRGWNTVPAVLAVP